MFFKSFSAAEEMPQLRHDLLLMKGPVVQGPVHRAQPPLQALPVARPSREASDDAQGAAGQGHGCAFLGLLQNEHRNFLLITMLNEHWKLEQHSSQFQLIKSP